MIFTLTLNPAIDKVLFLPYFQRAKTNRLSRTVETIGGKGTHVSINLHTMGINNIALGVVIGENGKRILKQLRAMGVEEKFLDYQLDGLESRTNYEIVEENGSVCTMLTEKGPLLPKNVTDTLLNQIREITTEGDILVLTGDASNVEDITIYSQLTRLAREKGVSVFLDASGEYLRQSLEACPYLIKPNLEELSCLAGKELNTIEEIIDAIKGLASYKIPVIAMTWSGNGAIIKWKDELFHVHPIKVNAKNEAGCGDAFLSAIIAGFETGENLITTLKTAAAVAAATAESELTVGFDQQRVNQLLKLAVVEKIPG